MRFPSTRAQWLRAGLGKVSDCEVARRLGCGYSRVFRARHRFGISATMRQSHASRAERARAILLRKKGWKLREIADILGRERTTVSLWTRVAVPSRRVDWDSELPTEGGRLLEPLTAIAKRLGVCVSAASAAAKRRGLQPFDPCAIDRAESIALHRKGRSIAFISYVTGRDHSTVSRWVRGVSR